MASSMLLGDRRWGQTRKSGMTILGKVPKPINLPSQRLENHGLDRNVEIVPRGSLTWGSGPSLATPNTLGSSTLSSPNTDGSTSSPNCHSGHPSSVGSLLQPSAGGGDRSHQPVSSAWGSNSRPSSASGVSPSNQRSVLAAHPHGAETRPGSSQLSEPGAETSAHGSTRIPEKLGPASQSNNFTLSSGDFPALGSEKNSNANLVKQGHNALGCPSPTSGAAATQETVAVTPTGNEAVNHCLDKGNVSYWKSSAVPPGSNNRHNDPQQTLPYPISSTPSYQFNSWSGPLVWGSTDGIWCGGGPPGNLHRPSGSPGNYPIESCMYHPQLPARTFCDSQGPHHGSVLGGYDPKNEKPQHTPDPYMVASHPVVRPGVYPCQVRYDSYHRPLPNFGNANERDGSISAMAPHPSFYNQYLTQNPNVDSGNIRTMHYHYAPSRATKQAESGHVHGSHEPRYNVLLKQHEGCKDSESEENKDLSVADSIEEMERKDCSGASKPAQKNGKDDSAKIGLDDGLSSQPASGSEVHSSIPSVRKSVAISAKSEISDDQITNAASQVEDSQRYVVKKNAKLIEKIEGSNDKARFTNGCCVNPAPAGEEKKRKSENVNAKVVLSEVTPTSTVMFKKEQVSFEDNFSDKASTEKTNFKSIFHGDVQMRAYQMHSSAVGLLYPSEVGPSTHSHTHRKGHIVQNRGDCRTKSRFDRHEAEMCRKKSFGKDSLTISNIEDCTEVRMQDCRPSQDISEKKVLHHTANGGDDSFLLSSFCSVDYETQLQVEEERTRERKARALAKLQELTRRTLLGSSNQTLNHSTQTSNQAQPKQDRRACPDAKVNTVVSDTLDSVSASKPGVTAQTRDDNIETLGVATVSQTKGSTVMLEQSNHLSPNDVTLPFINHESSMNLVQDSVKTEGSITKSSSQFHDNGLTKQKLMPHKRQQSNSQAKHVPQKNICAGIVEGLKSLGESLSPTTSVNVELSNVKDMDESSIQHKKRNNRMRNKRKCDEAPPAATLESLPKVENLEKVLSEHGKPKTSELAMEDGPRLPQTSTGAFGVQRLNVVAVSPSQGLSQGLTEAPSIAMEQWKPNHSRRVTRNPQGTKSRDKFHGSEAVVWAPVRSINRKEPSEELQGTTGKAKSDSSNIIGNEPQLYQKSKRAEMAKHADKELSLRGNLQPPSSPVASGLNVEFGSLGTTENGSVIVTVGPPAAAKYVESTKPNRHGRTRMSWRQRGTTESSSILTGLLEGSSADADSTKDNLYLQHPSKLGNLLKDQTIYSDDDQDNDNDYLTKSESAPAVVKDCSSANQGRRQPFKGHKNVVNNYSPRNKEFEAERTEKMDSQMLCIQPEESAGRNYIRNDNQSASGHLKSYWQPKSQAHSTHSKSRGAWLIGEKEIASQSNISNRVPEDGNHGQFVESSNGLNEVTVTGEIRNIKQLESKRGKRVGKDSNAPGQNLNHDSPTATKLASQDAQPQKESVLAESRQQGLHSGRSSRGHETNFRGAYVQQDSAKHDLPSDVDRWKNNSHSE